MTVPRKLSSAASRAAALNSNQHSNGITTNGVTNGHNGNTVNGDDQWEYEEIVLEKEGGTGMGFCIAGGTDNPHIPSDPSIFVTKVVDGYTAARDGRMRVGDAIVRVNDKSTESFTHADAVDALKKAGNRIKLTLRRSKLKRETETSTKVEKNSSNGRVAPTKGPIRASHSAFSPPSITNSQKPSTPIPTSVSPPKSSTPVPAINANPRKPSTPTPMAAPNRVPSPSVSKDVTEGSRPLSRASSQVKFADPSPRPSSPADTRPPSPAHARSASPALAYQTLSRIMPDTDQPPVSREPRQIILKKRLSGFGFNIVGGENGEGVYVSFILAGGAADVRGELRKGDQILEVNGVDLSNASHEKAATIIKNSPDVIDILAVYKPEDYAQFEAKIRNGSKNVVAMNLGNLRTLQKKTLFVRALFDYDSSKDSGLANRGLSFHYGDVLHVINATDENWWLARKMFPECPEDEIPGIIPSKKRVEKKERSRLRNIKFPARLDTKAIVIERDRRKESENTEKNKKNKDSNGNKSAVVNDERVTPVAPAPIIINEEPVHVPSYELVVQQELQYTRPLLVLGPLKDKINDDLVTEFPRKFTNCVPHTSRERREHEVEGRDYCFVSRSQMEADIQAHLFIEAGQYNKNLYGTSLAAVRKVADSGRHCILDVSGHAIKRLQAGGLFPIVVFTSPQSPQVIMNWLQVDIEEANKHYEKAYKLEQEFGSYFTATVTGDTAEEVYARVKQVIYQQSISNIWVPSKEKL